MLPGIRNDIRVAESFAAGQPVRYYAPKSRAGQDYQNLTDAVLALFEKPIKNTAL
jgi:chromosome partitioning protein